MIATYCLLSNSSPRRQNIPAAHGCTNIVVLMARWAQLLPRYRVFQQPRLPFLIDCTVAPWGAVLFPVPCAVSNVAGVHGSNGRDDELGDAEAQPEQAPLSPRQVRWLAALVTGTLLL